MLLTKRGKGSHQGKKKCTYIYMLNLQQGEENNSTICAILKNRSQIQEKLILYMKY